MGSEGEGGVRERGGVRKRGVVKEGGGARERGVRERGGVRKRGRVRERGGSEVCSSCVGAHGRGCTWSWARIVRGRVSVVGVYRSWASLSSMGGALSSKRDGQLWVVGRGVVMVPGRCLWALGIV